MTHYPKNEVTTTFAFSLSVFLMQNKTYLQYQSPFHYSQRDQAMEHWQNYLVDNFGKEHLKDPSGLQDQPERGLVPIKIYISFNAYTQQSLEELQKTTFNQLESVFNEQCPAFCAVVQPPENERFLCAEIILAPRKGIRFTFQDSLPQVIVVQEGNRELWSSAIVDSYANHSHHHAENSARKCFEGVRSLLELNGMGFDHIFRQWNYIGQIVEIQEEDHKNLQNYQVFNEIRSEYYQRKRNHDTYPAATGIGMQAEGIAIDFVAVSNIGKEINGPMRSPVQKNAFDYAQECLVGDGLSHPPSNPPLEKPPYPENKWESSMYTTPIQDINLPGKRQPPLFERGRYFTGNGSTLMMVSGTASIRGEETIAKGNAMAQLENTVEFIHELVHHMVETMDPISPSPHGKIAHIVYDRARLYVKKGWYTASLSEKFRTSYPGKCICTLVEADVCRDDLLIEIEADLHLE